MPNTDPINAAEHAGQQDVNDDIDVREQRGELVAAIGPHPHEGA